MPDLPSMPSVPSIQHPPVPARRFDDAAATRKNIYDNALTAAQNLPDYNDGKHIIRITNVGYHGPETFSKAEQKQSILENRTIGRKLRGTWQMSDANTGQLVDERTSTIATIPHMTDRGTFIHRGTEYGLINQLRLRPGIYTRIKGNDEIEAHANIAPGQGVSHRYFLDPAKGTFYARMGQAKIPLLPLLRASGATDNQLRDAWGPEILAANVENDSPAAMRKYEDRLLTAKEREAEGPARKAALLAAVSKMKLDPEVTKRTLGRPHAELGLDAILDTTKKLLALSRGEAEVDDRDHLANQTVHGPEDLIAERIARDAGGHRRQLARKASFRGNLKSIPPNALNRQVFSALLGSGLGMAMEETNASEVLDKQTRVTRMGQGGIPSIDSIPDEARSVQDSHANFVDPVRTPECYSQDTEVMTKQGWKFWENITQDDELACLVDGNLQFHRPLNLVAADYTGIMYGAHTKTLDYLVTPNHRMYVRRGDDTPLWVVETADKTHNAHCRKFLRTGFEPVEGTCLDSGLLPIEKTASNMVTIANSDFDLGDWAEFVGWYLSEGNFTFDDRRGKQLYRLDISQCPKANPKNCRQLYALLDRLPFTWKASKCDPRRLEIHNKQLVMWARQFGYCADKFLPPQAFEWPVQVRVRLLESLLLGDGRTCRKGSKKGEKTQFCSTSKKLAEDVQRLLFGLGVSSKIVFEPDDREERYLGCWIVHIHQRKELTLTRKSHWTGKSNHYTQDYSGKIYCAEVPGGLLHVRRGGCTGFWCGNSFRAGVDLFFTGDSMKGSDGQVYAPFRDSRTGQTVYKSPRDILDTPVALPGEMAQQKRHVYAMREGKIRLTRKQDVRYSMPSGEGLFSPLSNMVPFKSASKGQRVAMGSRYLTQALPLVDPESPYVQAGVPDSKDESYESRYGERMGAIKAKKAARVMSVTPTNIKVRYADGTEEDHELDNTLPHNRKTEFHQTPTVEAGETVQPGQLLARSNYTDASGVTALGKNARVAFLSHEGKNFEDAFVISNAFAKRLTSEHIYQHNLDKSDDHKLGRGSYVSLFPGKYTAQQLDSIDESGVVKPGTRIEKDDPLILAAGAVEPGKHKVHRRGGKMFNDAAVTWDHSTPGVVTDVVNTDHGISVVVKTQMPMQIGDKISGRHGNKGVVSDIVPDHQMPHDKDGVPYELLANPLGIISRGNPSQIVEAALGKIAEKTGKPYRVPDFNSENDLVEFAKNELMKHNMQDLEDVYDPKTGRKIKGVFTGNQFVMKLAHQAEDKGEGRGTEGSYSAEGTPAKGGVGPGSKRISLLDLNAMLSHGAINALRDVSQVRGQRNEDYWLSFVQGHEPQKPGVPFVYKKFVNSLKAAGINVVSDGAGIHLMAMTDKDIDHLAGDRAIRTGDTVDFSKGLSPVTGGLFDPVLTGGHHSQRWSKIPLSEPMPNPVMEEPIRRILGLTKPQFETILSGKAELKTGGTGPEGIAKALKDLNLDKEIASARQDISGTKKTARDAAIRKLGYLKSAKELGVHPGEWVLNSAPVLPPAFRPISLLPDSKLPLVADPNYLYKELIDANTNLHELKDVTDDVSDERLAVYNAFKAVTGLGDPVHPKLVEKNVRGILPSILGSSPKFGMVQRRLLSTPVDLVGRGVATPNPDLDMDHIGLPEDQVWPVYKNLVVRRLRRRGLPVLEAVRSVENRTPAAREELMSELAARPVLVNRAPVLHRFGIMAFWPRLTKNHTVEVSPLVVKGPNLDFDGDMLQYHVPVSDDAVKDAVERMLPSRNLLSPADFKTPMHAPGQEYVGGLYAATQKPDKEQRSHRFATKQDAIRAFRRGEIDLHTPVEIMG